MPSRFVRWREECVRIALLLKTKEQSPRTLVLFCGLMAAGHSKREKGLAVTQLPRRREGAMPLLRREDGVTEVGGAGRVRESFGFRG